MNTDGEEEKTEAAAAEAAAEETGTQQQAAEAEAEAEETATQQPAAEAEAAAEEAPADEAEIAAAPPKPFTDMQLAHISEFYATGTEGNVARTWDFDAWQKIILFTG